MLIFGRDVGSPRPLQLLHEYGPLDFLVSGSFLIAQSLFARCSPGHTRPLGIRAATSQSPSAKTSSKFLVMLTEVLVTHDCPPAGPSF